MDAIKKKMQAMKIEKDNALDRADAAEEKVRQITEKLERVEEELRDTQKKMMQTENDLDKAQVSRLEGFSRICQNASCLIPFFSIVSTLLQELMHLLPVRMPSWDLKNSVFFQKIF
ncbi:unnamed protein product [Heligmosomoides polygyrus]|uniref:Tropomyosin n=1 Tax=Heligmosomoides polygyrus TaxID=6339 RepID=A0A183FHY8_HELPZ|nr:unnamed protein product [Heligmosomoides polygyrus]